MTHSPNTWPPVYTVKKHRLAKHVKLKAIDNHSLLITVPQRFSLKHIPGILEENKNWIIQHLAAIKVKQVDVLPHHIFLTALNETWKVYYDECQSSFEMIIRPTREIVFVGRKVDNQIYRKKLIAWIKTISKQYLSTALNALSQQTKIQYDSLTIRDQKTRWGSCSSDKSISLNYKLIFLPAVLVQHVMIHELCHTIHLNHSDAFWNKVRELDPDFRQHKRELRKADQYLPEWL